MALLPSSDTASAGVVAAWTLGVRSPLSLACVEMPCTGAQPLSGIPPPLQAKKTASEENAAVTKSVPESDDAEESAVDAVDVLGEQLATPPQVATEHVAEAEDDFQFSLEAIQAVRQQLEAACCMDETPEHNPAAAVPLAAASSNSADAVQGMSDVAAVQDSYLFLDRGKASLGELDTAREVPGPSTSAVSEDGEHVFSDALINLTDSEPRLQGNAEADSLLHAPVHLDVQRAGALAVSTPLSLMDCAIGETPHAAADGSRPCSLPETPLGVDLSLLFSRNDFAERRSPGSPCNASGTAAVNSCELTSSTGQIPVEHSEPAGRRNPEHPRPVTNLSVGEVAVDHSVARTGGVCATVASDSTSEAGERAPALQNPDARPSDGHPLPSRIAQPPKRSSAGGLAWDIAASGHSASASPHQGNTRKAKEALEENQQPLSSSAIIRRLMRKKPTVRQLLGKAPPTPVPVYSVRLPRVEPSWMYLPPRGTRLR